MVEDVGAQKGRLQTPFVFKQRFGHVEEARLDVDGFAVGRGGTVVGELTEVLREAAAEVDESGILVQASQDDGVQWVLGKGAYEEAEKTNARVWADGVGAALLDGEVSERFREGWDLGQGEKGARGNPITISATWDAISSSGILE